MSWEEKLVARGAGEAQIGEQLDLYSQSDDRTAPRSLVYRATQPKSFECSEADFEEERDGLSPLLLQQSCFEEGSHPLDRAGQPGQNRGAPGEQPLTQGRNRFFSAD
mmetsp:Transcript_6631/g.11159  ORF Transcript_6631/g.11159 Transcript_6631/m.11159 type:complete len:107 (-) Transcript_6631:2183-2503(-)